MLLKALGPENPDYVYIYIYTSGLAVNAVRCSNNACLRSLLCSLFEIERVRIVFAVRCSHSVVFASLFAAGVLFALCSRLHSQLVFCSCSRSLLVGSGG